MASKLLLRILTAARPGIQTGKLKMQDIVSEYFKQTGGKTIDAGDRAIIENEFIEFAPSNVTTPDAFKGFLNEGEIVNSFSIIALSPGSIVFPPVCLKYSDTMSCIFNLPDWIPGRAAVKILNNMLFAISNMFSQFVAILHLYNLQGELQILPV